MDKVVDQLGALGITEFVLAFSDPDSDQLAFGYSDELFALKSCRNIEDRVLYGDDDEG